ncbi:MAG TPA: PAS domain S-box protein, partial [Allocoleopsis sp.]
MLNAIAQMNRVRSDNASGEKPLSGTDDQTVSMRDSQVQELNRIAPSRCVLVLENECLIGIFTEQDVVRLSLQQHPLDRLSMRQVMTAPVVTLLDQAFTDLLAASHCLQQHGIGYLPIVDEQNRPVGLLNRESLQFAIAIQQSIVSQQLQAELSERSRTATVMQAQLTDLITWRDRYELAAQASGQMLYEYDYVHDVMTWGGKADRILGYPTAALPTSLSKWIAWIHPADQAKFSLSMAPSQVDETPICLQYRVQHQAGHYLWVEDRGQWLMNDRGEAIGVVGILMDVSTRQHVEEERQHAQLALQDSEAKHRAVLAAIPDLMFRVGADGVYRGFVTTHRELDFLSSDIDPVGRSMVDLLPAQLAEQQFYYLQQALQTGELQVYEQTIQVGDRWQDEEVRVIKSGEDEVLFMIRDITSRKRAEAALKQSELTNRTIIQTMPDLLIQMDRQGRYSYMVGGSAVHIKYPASPSTEPELY